MQFLFIKIDKESCLSQFIDLKQNYEENKKINKYSTIWYLNGFFVIL